MDVKFLRRVSSIAQSASEVVVVCERALLVGEEAVGVARQYCELLLTQKTSLQQAVTPRFGGRLVNGWGMWVETEEGRGVEELDMAG